MVLVTNCYLRTSLNNNKKKPGGQPGHQGTTRKGFDRVDKFEAIRIQQCPKCGSQSLKEIGMRTRQTAKLVVQPIEIVEYQQYQCCCQTCKTVNWGEMPADVIGEQDLEASLQGMLAWMRNYGHLSYEKQQEWLTEMGLVNIALEQLQTQQKE
jgi:transposase